MTNGTFATNLSSWTTSGNVLFSNFYSNGCAAFSAGNSTVNGIISQNISADAGSVLTVNLNYGRRGTTGATVAGLFEIIDNTTSTVVSSTTLTAPNTAGSFISTSFTITAPSNSLLVKFTDQTTNTASRDFYFNTVSITQPFPLPVNLLYFEAKSIESQSAKLNWATASEENNSHFEIQHSTDATSWRTIGKVEGNGTITEKIEYEFIDNYPASNTNYYRLKQVDFDSKYEYSKIISLNNGEIVEEIELKAYPIPSKGLLTVEGSEKELNAINIINILGENVNMKVVFKEISKGKKQLNINGLSDGVYILKSENSSLIVVKE